MNIGLVTNAIAEKTRDLIAPVSDYSLYLCHDGTGTTLTDSAPAAQQLFGNLTVNGTTAGIWGTESNFTPAGDHTVSLKTAAHLALGDLTTLTGQIIFFVDIFATGVPSTNFNTFVCYGDSGAGTDGFRFIINQTSGYFGIQHNDHASVLKSAPMSSNCCDSARHCLVGVVDPVNAVLTPYMDGTAGTSVAIDGDNLCQSNAWGWGILANLTSATPTFNTHLGGSGATGMYINRMGIMRTSSDQASNLGSIASGLAEIAHELPWAMDGV